MSFERMTDIEILSTIRDASDDALSQTARVLIYEMYRRIRSLEQQVSTLQEHAK